MRRAPEAPDGQVAPGPAKGRLVRLDSRSVNRASDGPEVLVVFASLERDVDSFAVELERKVIWNSRRLTRTDGHTDPKSVSIRWNAKLGICQFEQAKDVSAPLLEDPGKLLVCRSSAHGTAYRSASRGALGFLKALDLVQGVLSLEHTSARLGRPETVRSSCRT